MSGRIDIHDSVIDVIHKLSEGNPGAVTVLARWLKEGRAIDPDAMSPLLQMCSLDDLDIVGSQIWVLYKDVCDQDMRRFLSLLRAHQLGFLLTRELQAAARGEKPFPAVGALITAVEDRLPKFRQAREQAENEELARHEAEGTL